MIVANIGDIFLSLRPLRPPARQPWEPIFLPYASQHTQTRTHTYTHTDTHTHTYKHTHTRTHTNKHIHTQTYTHIHTHVDHQPLLIDCSAVPHHSSNHMMLAEENMNNIKNKQKIGRARHRKTERTKDRNNFTRDRTTGKNNNTRQKTDTHNKHQTDVASEN